jgi:hypothetical protein
MDFLSWSDGGWRFNVNQTAKTTYVAWTWDAGSSTVTNTEGSITSQVRANASAGFSVVTLRGQGSRNCGTRVKRSPAFNHCEKQRIRQSIGQFITIAFLEQQLPSS